MSMMHAYAMVPLSQSYEHDGIAADFIMMSIYEVQNLKEYMYIQPAIAIGHTLSVITQNLISYSLSLTHKGGAAGPAARN